MLADNTLPCLLLSAPGRLKCSCYMLLCLLCSPSPASEAHQHWSSGPKAPAALLQCSLQHLLRFPLRLSEPLADCTTRSMPSADELKKMLRAWAAAERAAGRKADTLPHRITREMSEPVSQRILQPYEAAGTYPARAPIPALGKRGAYNHECPLRHHAGMSYWPHSKILECHLS